MLAQAIGTAPIASEPKAAAVSLALVAAGLPRPTVGTAANGAWFGISGIDTTITAALPMPTMSLSGQVTNVSGPTTVVSGQLVDVYAAPRVIEVVVATTDTRTQIYTLSSVRRRARY